MMSTSQFIARGLLSSKLFEPNHSLSVQHRTFLSLQKAKAIASIYQLTRQDVETLSPAYWRLHIDPILLRDGAATTLLTIQLNLVAGTIAAFAKNRPDLSTLLEDLLHFNIAGQFCLTEVDHGLDAFNLETTATALPNGGFTLHTPHPGAAKCMPPTIPCGIPCIAVVFAKLIIEGRDHGVRPFVVPLNDGQNMCSGVTARLLPHRGGTNPINHSMTTFNHVSLPESSLLQLGDIKSTEHRRLEFLRAIWRVAVGSLSLAAIAIPILGLSALIAARYSKRRTVAGSGPGSVAGRVPLIHFKTQQTPILTALARSFVLKEFYEVATRLFSDERIDFRVRHGIAAALKVVAVQHAQEANIALSERCGAQGLFDYNQICTLHVEMRGIAIAEGDLLGLSIRLSSEVLLGRYELPASTHPESPLTRHEEALLEENRAILLNMAHHRNDDFNRHILPHCQSLVEAIGLRMAYDAALDAGLDSSITDLYLASAMKRDPIWYSENLGITRVMQYNLEEKALCAAFPKLDTWLEATGVEPYVSAPIVSEEKWAKFVDGLEVFTDKESGKIFVDPTDPITLRARL